MVHAVAQLRRAGRAPAGPALCPMQCVRRPVAATAAARPPAQQRAPAGATRPAAAPHNRPQRRSVAAAAAGGEAAGGGMRVRRLILLRHADSEQASGMRDHDRPISGQGKREAASIGGRLASKGWLPDLIIASNSARTKQTLDAMAQSERKIGEADTHFLGSLYTVAALDGQTRQQLELCIRNMADDDLHLCVMCVGHNKGWEEAACSWARTTVRLNTACAALFEAAGRSWEEVLAPEAEWKLVEVVTP